MFLIQYTFDKSVIAFGIVLNIHELLTYII